MIQNNDNKLRAFSDVVTIEAWHDAFADQGSRVSLHADVVFSTARIGGEAKAPVRFRLSLREAELVVVVPELEPLSIDAASVSRDAPVLSGQATFAQQKQQRGQLEANAGALVSPSAASLAASASAEVSLAAMHTACVELTADVTSFAVTHSRTADGHHRWRLAPVAGDRLSGRPWNPTSAPRLKLVDERGLGTAIAGAVRVEVRCRREDLLIEELVLKDQCIWDSLTGRAGEKNRMAAAISFIRDRLVENGLEFSNLDDPFGVVTLSTVIAQETR